MESPGGLWFSTSKAWEEPAVGRLIILGDAVDDGVAGFSPGTSGLKAVRGRVGFTDVITDDGGDLASNPDKICIIWEVGEGIEDVSDIDEDGNGGVFDIDRGVSDMDGEGIGEWDVVTYGGETSNQDKDNYTKEKTLGKVR